MQRLVGDNVCSVINCLDKEKVHLFGIYGVRNVVYTAANKYTTRISRQPIIYQYITSYNSCKMRTNKVNV